jgi:hypothetical protein
MSRCIIPSCTNPATNNFGVRLRRPDTTAIWAPNTEAYICDAHAIQGLIVNVTLEPTNTGEIETKVIGQVPPTTANRVTPIK